jgi:hypothetical protein
MAEEWFSVRIATEIVLGLAAGFILAQAHLAALAANVRLYLEAGAGWRPVGLHVLRFAVVISSFAIAAMFGALVLVAMLVGFTLGRVLGLRRYR